MSLLVCLAIYAPIYADFPLVSGAGAIFATRLPNVFVIGRGDKPLVSLPKHKGIKLNILQEAAKAKASA